MSEFTKDKMSDVTVL